MANYFWTPRRQKIGLIVSIVFIVFFVALLSLNAVLAPIIGRKIKAGVLKGSDSLYQVSFSAVHINVFTGNAELDDIRLTVDSDRAKTAGSVATGNAKELKISQAHFLAYWLHKRVEIGDLTLVDPSLSYQLYQPPKTKNSKPLYQKIDPVRLIAVERIHLENARLSYSDLSGPKADVQHLKDLDLEATGLRVDSASERDTTRTLFCRDVIVGLKNFNGYTDGGLYHYGFKKAHFSTRSGKLIIRGISLTPLPENVFFQRSNSDRFDCALDSLVVERFNYRSFLRNRFVTIQKVSGLRGNIGVFGNPNGKLTKADRLRTFPHFMIRTLPVHFTVDTVEASGIAVNYREFNQDDGKTGILEFKDTKARFMNISNQAKRLQAQPLCKAQLSSLFMGRCKLQLNIDFNLADKVYAYSYQGHLDAMPLITVNPLAMPLGLVKIKSGELKYLNFSIKADQLKSSGTLHLLYDDLSVEVLNKDYSNKALKTLAVKIFVVKKSNPDQQGAAPRFAKVVYLRPKSDPFFKTLWETLFSGLKPCAGIGYAVKQDAAKPLSKQEQKAKKKALKKAIKAKKKADKEFNKKLKS